MRKNLRKIKLAAISMSIFCALTPVFNRATAGENGPEPTSLLKEIAGYKHWTKVNGVPQLMPQRVAAACALVVSRSGVVIDGSGNSHRDKYFTVYVNEAGREAMLTQKVPTFPEGTIIVKEKLPTKESETPELLTVMFKRSKGFNAVSGDWEYAVLDGSGTKVDGRGKLENCQACHIANQDTDYIFRTYLSDEDQSKLK
jgi:Cytochrome P460